MTVVAPAALYSVDDGTGDPWIGKPYRWTVNLTVSAQPHASHLTPTPYAYTAADVAVGDWFADAASARAVRIVSITNRLTSNLQAVVEDVDRFNTFSDPTVSGTGIGSGLGLIFRLDADGQPVLGPLGSRATALSSNPGLREDIRARFAYRTQSPRLHTVVQPGHGLAVDDLVCLTPSGYVKMSPANAELPFAGVVTGVGIPDPTAFDLTPPGDVRVFAAALPGQPGDRLYIGDSGLVATAPSANIQPVLLRLEDSHTAVVLGSGFEVAQRGYINGFTLVDDPDARDGLAGLNPGDQVYVRDDGNGYWATYVYDDTAGLVRTTTQEISTSTPGSRNILLAAASEDDGSFARLLYGTRVVEVTIEVLEAFDGSASIHLFNSVDGTVVMDDDASDLSTVGRYTVFPAYQFLVGAEADLMYHFTRSSVTTGLLRVSVSFI
jgi:hypothetical protein